MTIEAARDALLADARDEARRLGDQAEADAQAVLARAHEAADRLIAQARADGQAEGRIQGARAVAREHALARMQVLAARRELHDELRRQAQTAVLSLREEPGYRTLLDELVAAARHDLGEDAELDVEPEDAGGVRGRAGSRRVDYTLPTLAQRCIDALGPRLRRLWT